MASKTLKISGYTDEAKLKSGSGAIGSLTVAINPETIDFSYNIGTSESNNSGEYNSNLSLSLILDGTGVLYKSDYSVSEQADLLKKLTIAYYGDALGTPYVSLEWGKIFNGISLGDSPDDTSQVFKGKATSLNIKYNLFSRSGKPIRAIVTLNVKQFIELDTGGKKAKVINLYKESNEEMLIKLKREFMSKLEKARAVVATGAKVASMVGLR